MPGPFYHDFTRLGLPCEQLAGIFAPNQQAKEPVITAYILLALAKLRNRGIAPVSFAELFCADGYYTMFARKFGADTACGFDNDRDGFLRHATEICGLLNLDKVEFHRMDVHDVPVDSRFSIVANVGGLYHVSDPVEVLRISRRMAQRYLIVQSVVSVANTDENYFVSPAPGWTWGCRFSRQSFDRAVRELGCLVIDSEFNLLPGNTNPDDQGSVYYLLDTEQSPKGISAPSHSGFSPGDHHYRAYVGPPEQYDLMAATQFNLLTSLGLRDHHFLLDFGCGSLRAGRLFIPYLQCGHYYGVEPNHWLVEEALRFETGQDLASTKQPIFSTSDDFTVPFECKFDYVLIQSVFTHLGSELAMRLLQSVAGSLQPNGLALVSFLKTDYIDTDSAAAGWVYPDCVSYTSATIQSMAASAELQCQALPWYNPRVTWYVLTRRNPLTPAQVKLMRGPVLRAPAFAGAQLPTEGRFVTIDGSELFVEGTIHAVQPASLGYVDVLQDNGTTLSVVGWAVESETRAPAQWFAATNRGHLVLPSDCTSMVRGDVCQALSLEPDKRVGFCLVIRKPADFDQTTFRVLAWLPGGTVVELPGAALLTPKEADPTRAG